MFGVYSTVQICSVGELKAVCSFWLGHRVVNRLTKDFLYRSQKGKQVGNLNINVDRLLEIVLLNEPRIAAFELGYKSLLDTILSLVFSKVLGDRVWLGGLGTHARRRCRQSSEKLRLLVPQNLVRPMAS
jgi:hypothetical protein